MNLKQINKNDIIALTILFSAFFFLLYFSWGYWGNPIVDSARELYLPTLVMDGKVLYKDILNLYGPFSYQFNALLYSIFGVSINVLYLSGVITTILILTSAYLICRTISSPFTSFIAVFTPMSVLVFRCAYFCTSNYFFPYSYAIIYSFSTLLISLLFFIYFLKTKKNWLLYLSSFFIGLSIASKLDYSFFAIFILATIFTGKNLYIKEKITNIFLILLPALTCWSILFYQGVRPDDIYNILEFGRNFANAPSVKFFNEVLLGQIPTLMNIKMCIKYFCFYSVFYSIFLATGFCIAFFLKKVKSLFGRLISFALFIPVFLWGIDIISAKMNDIFKFYLDFSWTSYLILAILFTHLAYEKLVNKNNIKSLPLKSKIFTLITIIGLLASHRTFFLVSIGFVGNFSCLLYFMSTIIYFMEILPNIFASKNTRFDTVTWKKTIALSFIMLSFVYLFNYHREMSFHPYKLKNIEGSWYWHNDIGYAIDKSADFVKANIKPTQTILMLPEGPILSFMTKVPTHPKYYSLIPHMTETFGEDNVIADLNKNKPDYIFINNLPNLPYKPGEFGKKYMVKTYKFVEDNYDHITTYPEKDYIYKDGWMKKWNINIKIYKVKNSKEE